MTAFARMKALLLLAVLVGGGAATDADALIFHSQPGSARQSSHIEQPRGCGEHAERCALSASFSPPRLAAGATAITTVRDRSRSDSPPRRTFDVPAPTAHSPLQPRAPPTHLS